MRISDWSSDVCSSDLGVAVDDGTIAAGIVVVAAEGDGGRAGDAADMDVEAGLGGLRLAGDVAFRIDLGGGRRDMHREVVAVVDRKSVVQGKSVSVRVDIGGRRCLNKKKKKKPSQNTPVTINTHNQCI